MAIGKSCRTSIYFYIEKSSIKRDQIPQRLEDFSSTIQKIFGQGSLVIQRLILRKLCAKLNVNYESVKDREFQVAVGEIRNRQAGQCGGERLHAQD